MRNSASYLLATYFVAQTLCHPLYGESDEQKTIPVNQTSNQSTENTQFTPPPQPNPPPSPPTPPTPPTPPQPSTPKTPFTSFTGRTLKNKVRIRLQPSLDAPILREINKGDLFVVIDEADDFYAIEAPADVKGYVFRTYILDNVIEGNRVNVRLEPNLESPIIAQLNAGDKVDGQISALNSKWVEITPPDTTRFFIAKEYVEKIGNSGLKAILEKKREEGTQLLNSTFTASQTELRKPWNEINLNEINDSLNKIVKNYTDFPEIQLRAKELLTMIQESYFQKKIEYLETLAKNTDLINAQNKELSNKLTAQEQRISELEQSNAPAPAAADASNLPPPPPSYGSSTSTPVDRMNMWLPVENQLYESWAESHENQPISAFYDDQLQKAKELKGVIQLYDRSVRNKPGDYVLLNPTTRIPVAYLYSTQVNLQDYVNKEVTVKVAPRENNNFAYPAYFVLAVE